MAAQLRRPGRRRAHPVCRGRKPGSIRRREALWYFSARKRDPAPGRFVHVGFPRLPV